MRFSIAVRMLGAAGSPSSTRRRYRFPSRWRTSRVYSSGPINQVSLDPWRPNVSVTYVLRVRPWIGRLRELPPAHLLHAEVAVVRRHDLLDLGQLVAARDDEVRWL